MSLLAVTPKSLHDRRHYRTTTTVPSVGVGRGSLLEAAVNPKTLKMYRAALIQFADYMWEHGEDPMEDNDFDDILLDYMQDLYEHGGARSTARNTLYGLCVYFPRFSLGGLPKARQAVRGWSKLAVGRSYPPMTQELATAVAVHLRCNPRWCRHAIGVVLAFDCLLRIGELVNLRREDVADDDDPRLGYRPPGYLKLGMVIRIRQAKTGPNQHVTVYDPQVKQLVRQLLHVTKPEELLFPFSAAIFRNVFKLGCADLNLSSLYVPHSLRHGAATRFKHLLHWTMEDVMHRGRWKSADSAKIYIQAGVVMLMAMAVPPGLSNLGYELSNSLFALLRLW